MQSEVMDKQTTLIRCWCDLNATVKNSSEFSVVLL